MTRDMDLVREILREIEKSSSGYAPDEITVENHSDEQVHYHILLLIEAGLIEGNDVSTIGGESPRGVATRLTWEGHEFLDASRDQGRWDQAKKIGNSLGGYTLNVFLKILEKLMIDQIP